MIDAELDTSDTEPVLDTELMIAPVPALHSQQQPSAKQQLSE
jgi:hypothetical protein